MKRLILSLSLALMITFSAGALSAQDGKIAYIDIPKILSESDMGKEVYMPLKSMIEQREAEAKAKHDKLNTLRETFEVKSSVMTEQAKKDLKDQYERDSRELENYVQTTKEELKKGETTVLNPWSKELDVIIKSYAEKNGIEIVLNKANPATAYASDKTDITGIIMDLFNKRYKEKSGKAKKE